MSEDLLEQAELKATKQRRFILSVLEFTHKPLTAEEILKASPPDVKVNLSTIYRTLGVLTEKGILIKTINGDGKACYQFNHHPHCHLLRCSVCDGSVRIDSCPIEQLCSQLEEQTGYTVTGHSLEITGVCPDCARRIWKDKTT
ncbi:Fur family transcriptional regulator [Candidatus Soleaferrea massiliensis]|uniref:Fur family transcriptional regulator n=1 Tax=Candidatus Soleaferrea massiliensis TaxID=1470354 RepID=UPI0006944DAB|nr:Fur family transcriptional regulator [Candidatus Soleaferrea massiliensis]